MRAVRFSAFACLLLFFALASNASAATITVDISGTSLEGLRVGDDELDVVIRGVMVTSAKPDHKGNVTLILHGDNLELLS